MLERPLPLSRDFLASAATGDRRHSGRPAASLTGKNLSAPIAVHGRRGWRSDRESQPPTA